MSAATVKPRPPGWLFVMFLALLATATDEFIIAGVLPAVADDLGVGVPAAGQLVTVFAVVYAVGAPTLTALCDRFPRRTVMATALGAFVLANVLAAVAPGYWSLMGARIAAALAAAVIAAAAFATAAAGAPRGEQGRYAGLAPFVPVLSYSRPRDLRTASAWRPTGAPANRWRGFIRKSPSILTPSML
jgi:predicted MFS family arabinose efflux permease